MFVGLATILCIWQYTNVAFTWYFLIGSVVTFVVGSIVSAFNAQSAAVAPSRTE
jgi:hypothetical protein